MEHLDVDAVAIWSHMQHHDKELSHKRKFLMGLSSVAYSDQYVRSHAGHESILPESFLRKDDVFYEDVKNLVERGFGAYNVETQPNVIQDDAELYDLHNMSRVILALLDDLSNNGLYCLAKIVSRGLVTFVKTRPQMKRFIKNSLDEIRSNQLPRNYQVKLQNNLSQLLKNPKVFRQNHRKHVYLTMKSHHSDIMKVLDGLEDMPFQTLNAMYRKLKGTQGSIPGLHPHKSGWTRDRLVDRVRKLCLDMIYSVCESDKLKEPLAKAMAVAVLYSEIASCSQGVSVRKFLHVTPEMEALQNEIVKAIRSLDKKTGRQDMKDLLRLLEPDSEMEVRRPKTAIKNMLMEFLFECSDMDTVPDFLLDALSLINKKKCIGRLFLSKDLIEEDVECILNVGAHIKQILWECDRGNQLDQEFVDAYMEELEESDDDDTFEDDDVDQMKSNDFIEEVGSTGGADDASSALSACKDSLKNTNEFLSGEFVNHECRDTGTSGGKMLNSTAGQNGLSHVVSPVVKDECVDMGGEDPLTTTFVDSANTDENCSKQIGMSGYHRNRYVDLQDVCDNASVFAYQLIGHVLEEFGQREALGLDWDDESYLRGESTKPQQCQDSVANSTDKDATGSIIAQAVRKVIPSFSNSQLEMVKEFMNS